MTVVGSVPLSRRRGRLDAELTRHRDGLRVDLIDPDRLVDTVASLPLDEAVRLAARIMAAVQQAPKVGA